MEEVKVKIEVNSSNNHPDNSSLTASERAVRKQLFECP